MNHEFLGKSKANIYQDTKLNQSARKRFLDMPKIVPTRGHNEWQSI